MSCPSQSTQLAEFHNVILTTQLVEFLISYNSPSSPVHYWAVNSPEDFSLSFIVLTLLTTYLTSRIGVLLEKPTVELVKNFPHCKETESLHRAVNSLLTVPVLSQTNPEDACHHISWRYIWILLCILRLGLPVGIFPSGLCTKTLNSPVFSSISTTYPNRLFLFNMITRTRSCAKNRSWSF